TNKAWVDEAPGRLDNTERKKLWDNVWKGGRTISYQQSANATYTLPTNKLPLLDWTTMRVGYNSTYNWLGASLIARSLGNTLANTQQKNVTGEFDFGRLYSKSRILRALDETAPPVQPKPIDKATDTTGKKKKVKRDPNAPVVLGAGVKFIGGIFTALKRVSLNYSENAGTTLYGYTDSTRLLGMNYRTSAPGMGFVFGGQPDTNFVNRLGNRGFLTGDPEFNFLNKQEFNQKLSLTAQLIPIRDFTIDVNLDKTFGKTYSELYKDTIGYSGKFSRLSPYAGGSFSVSFISFQTLFENVSVNQVSATFKQFEANRKIISERLGKLNGYSGQQQSDGYYKGYGKYAQDVLIPAFISAYTGKDPMTIALIEQSNPQTRSNPFKGYLPRPNWRVTYSGLSRIPALQSIFTNFTISHAYNSTLSMNSFTSSRLFQ
ncbi:MAG: cell surface protein SprA, partial [Chitinophagaceae bacterium]